MKNEHVLVTTKYRGVFMGRVVDDSKLPEEIELGEVQMAVYFGDGTGVFGLAEDGPTNCRITSPLTHSQKLWGVTSCGKVTEGALKKWKECPWV